MTETTRTPLENDGAHARPGELIELIRASVIGDDEACAGPFGVRRLTYADYTASGRSLTFVEDYIRDQVMPLYANTHTESSGTGRQTTRFREDARDIVRDACRADRGEYAVIFCGSGSTAAVDKLIGIMNLRIPADLDERYGLRSHIPPDERPVVFIGPYEHHSNELPWRESIADLVTIHEDPDGRIDLAHLADELRRFDDRPLRIGSFSAASNVTGIKSDTRGISALLHRHGALVFWDYGAAAPLCRARCLTQAAGRRRGHGRQRPRLQGRDLHLAAQVHRWPGLARPARRPPRAADQLGPGRSRRRHGGLRQRRGARLPR